MIITANPTFLLPHSNVQTKQRSGETTHFTTNLYNGSHPSYQLHTNLLFRNLIAHDQQKATASVDQSSANDNYTLLIITLSAHRVKGGGNEDTE